MVTVQTAPKGTPASNSNTENPVKIEENGSNQPVECVDESATSTNPPLSEPESGVNTLENAVQLESGKTLEEEIIEKQIEDQLEKSNNPLNVTDTTTFTSSDMTSLCCLLQK